MATKTPREKRRAQQKRLPPIDANQRYEIPEGSVYLRQSVAKTYLDIKNKKLEVIQDEGRTYIPGSELIRRSTLPKRPPNLSPQAHANAQATA